MNFDTFSVLFNTSDDKQAVPLISYQSVMINSKMNIKIINYTSLKLKDLMPTEPNEVEEKWKSRTTILDKFPVSMDEIVRFADTLCHIDVLMVIGADLLSSNTDQNSVIISDIKKYHMQMHSQSNENWNDLTNNLTILYDQLINKLGGLIFIFDVDLSTAKKASALLEQSDNLSILITESADNDEDSEAKQLELIEQIGKMNMSEGLNLIKIHEDLLPKKAIIYLSALVHFKNGETSTAIDILESLHSNNPQVLLFLSDLYMSNNQRDQAYLLLQQVESQNKYTKGLTDSLVRYHQNAPNNVKEALIKSRKPLDPDNPALIEYEASFLSATGAYAASAALFRKLKGQYDNEYYELVARINDLLENPPEPSNARDYIDDIIKNHSHVRNEGILRLSRYYLQCQDSPYWAYQTLQDADDDLFAPRGAEIAREKLELLRDNFVASRALRKIKPYKKAIDAQKLIEVRLETLLKNIPILATQKNGVLCWREFIGSQSEETWKNALFNRTITELKSLSQFDYTKLLAKSKIKSIKLDNDLSLTCENCLYLIRNVKSGEFSDESISHEPEAFARHFLTLPTIQNNTYFNIVIRYYTSIVFSIWGLGQDANNYALSIFDIQEQTDDSNLKMLALYLGLLSWGFSQYKIGLHVEGIACILSVINQLQKIDVLPFIEEGLTLLSKFILDMDTDLPDQIVMEILENNETLLELNPTFAMFQGILTQNGVYVSSLMSKVHGTVTYDIDWAITTCNLVSLLSKNRHYSEARELIDAYSSEVIVLLEQRKDIRWQAVYGWAQCIFFSLKRDDDLDRIIDLIDLAIEDCEDRRIVAHKEERGALANSFERLYRYYLNILGVYFGISDIPESKRTYIRDKILGVISKLVPRAIIEQHTYFEGTYMPPDLIELEKTYQNTINEYNNLVKNGAESEYIDEKGKRLEKIQKELVCSHPNYRFLSNYNAPNWNELIEHLQEKSIIFQYFLLDMVSINVIIDSTNIHIYSQMFDIKGISPSKLKASLSGVVNDVVRTEYPIFLNHATELMIHGLIDYKATHTTPESVYVIPDYTLGMYNLISGIPYQQLAADIKTQINIIEYQSATIPIPDLPQPCKISCGVFGNPNNSALGHILNWLKPRRNSNFLFEHFNDESTLLWADYCNSNGSDIAFVFGHGVHDFADGNSYGALGLQGMKRIIPIRELIENLTSKVLFIISCSGGTPSSDNPEISKGVWTEVIEHFSGSVVLCKWDVDVKATLKLIDLVLDKINKEIPVSTALLDSQKELANNTDFTKWAGLEFWQN